MIKLDSLKKNLISPPEEYYPVVMWFWNDDISEREIKRQLGELKKKKIYEFFIHPMWGFQLRYLSDRFFRLVGVAVDYARENGMKFWIYDEYDWPSGTAGGELIRKHPSYKASYLSFAKIPLKAGEKASGDYGWPIVAAFFNEEGKTPVKAKGFTKKGAAYEYTAAADGVLTVVYRQRHQGMTTTAYGAKYSNEEPGYIDLMSKKAVNAFFASTHEKYKEYFKNDFGKTLKGVFTDEPTYSLFVDTKDGVVPYTDLFFKEFRAFKGYDAKRHLWKMFEPPVEKSVKAFKKDWFETLSHLFETNFSINYREWCHKNGVLLTGHLICEEVLSINTYENGYYYDILKHFDRPGMDTILSKYCVTTERFNIAGYMIGSVGKFAGRERVLSETYSGSGWSCSLADMKHIANRLMIEGVNFLQYMGAYYSMRGMRKVLPGGYPPTHNDLSPQFYYYTALGEYLARFQYLSANSVSDGRTLVLHPITSCFTHADARYTYNGSMAIDYYAEGSFVDKDATLCGIVNALQKMNKSFNIGFETALEDAVVENGKIVAAGSEYSLVILPGVTDVKKKTAALLKEFVRQGGTVLLANTDAVLSCEENFRTLFKAPAEAVEALKEQNASSGAPRVSRVFGGKNVFALVTNETRLSMQSGLAGALSVVYDFMDLREPVTIKGDGVISGVRKDGDRKVIFLTNDLPRETTVFVTLKEDEAAVIIDADTLKATLTSYDERTPLTFGGNGGKIMITGKKAEIADLFAQFEKDTPITISGKAEAMPLKAEFPYNLYRFYHRLAKQETIGDLLTLAPSALEKALSSEPDKWLKPMGEKGHWTNFSAADQRLYPLLDFGKPFITYSEFEIKDVPEKCEILCEKLFDSEVIINGKKVDGFRQKRMLSPDDLYADAAPYLKKGKNTLILKGECVKWGYYHTPPFAALKGDFAVKNDVIMAPAPLSEGDVTQNGYPYFAGEFCYTAAVKGRRHAVLEIEAFDPVEVYVGRKKAADLVSDPRRIDLTPFLSDGENKIKLVMKTKLNNIFDDPEPTGISSAKLYR